MSDNIRTRILQNHADLAPIAEVDDSVLDYHEWVHLGDSVNRDALGRRNHGLHKWLKVRCNNWDCPAEALIHEQDVVDAALRVDR
jgi:hypothetical protein